MINVYHFIAQLIIFVVELTLIMFYVTFSDKTFLVLINIHSQQTHTQICTQTYYWGNTPFNTILHDLQVNPEETTNILFKSCKSNHTRYSTLSLYLVGTIFACWQLKWSNLWPRCTVRFIREIALWAQGEPQDKGWQPWQLQPADWPV